jgi:SAM-dependent methyltransferase
MNEFSKDWLSLRQAADAAAREESFLKAMRFVEGHSVRVVDLGAGTGSNLRYLAPRLAVSQNWTMVDAAANLLSEIEIPQTEQELTVEAIQRDLASGEEELALEECDLVTASAFFDLVSDNWLDQFVKHCVSAKVANGLFALTVDGTIIWAPQDRFDTEIESLFNAHMRRDKGFGPALGSEAADRLAAYFEDAGYKVRIADTPWRLTGEDSDLQMQLLDGYVSAACEQSPEQIEQIRDWAARRALYIAQRQSALFVGHRDVLVQRV